MDLDIQVQPPPKRADLQRVRQEQGGQRSDQGYQIGERTKGAVKDLGRQATQLMNDPQKRKEMQENILGAGDTDKQVWALATDVPVVPSPCSWILGLINLFFPGWGTMMSSCFGGTCSKAQFTIGLIQFSLTWILVGYPLSWYWAYLIIKKSMDSDDDDEDNEEIGAQGSSNIGAGRGAPPHQRFNDMPEGYAT